MLPPPISRTKRLFRVDEGDTTTPPPPTLTLCDSSSLGFSLVALVMRPDTAIG